MKSSQINDNYRNRKIWLCKCHRSIRPRAYYRSSRTLPPTCRWIWTIDSWRHQPPLRVYCDPWWRSSNDRHWPGRCGPRRRPVRNYSATCERWLTSTSCGSSVSSMRSTWSTSVLMMVRNYRFFLSPGCPPTCRAPYPAPRGTANRFHIIDC